VDFLSIPVVIEYKDKKTSSGKAEDGVIYLSISQRLNSRLRKEHIAKLTAKLLSRMKWAQKYTFAESCPAIKTNKELLSLAEEINSQYYNLPLKDAAFHKQSSTWGTCSLITGKIYVSHRLSEAPADLVRYVVAHEICHLAVPGHNAQFWALVKRACPDYKECRIRLKAYGLKQAETRKMEFPGK
jgi:predicted metal-dependent hydrolase